MQENPTYLPILGGLGQAKRRGRSVYEGSQRGWGLQFGDLKQKVRDDPLYQRAFAPAADRTIMAEENRMNIFLIMRFFLGAVPFGHVIEYGSYRGGNAIFMALVAKALYPGMQVYALDTYDGMPPTDKDVDMHNQGDFRDAAFGSLMSCKDSLGLDNLIPVQGLFEDTSAKVLREAGPIALAHIDCDVSAAVQYSYESVKPAMVEGGYYVFDDALVSSCLGATEVVEDLLIRRDGLNCEQAWPHFVFRARRGAA